MGPRHVTMLIVATLLATASCSLDGGFGSSTSHAEQVDAHVVVRATVAAGREISCRKDRCRIHFTASVTSDSEDGVWARNCSLIVLDGDGQVLATTPIELGFPAGLFTRAGTTSHANGGAEVEIPRRSQDRIQGLDAWCRAYVWHGEPPI
jgi:hypothetical protein